MQRIHRCPNCTKASFDYGFCSEVCEKEFSEEIKKETKDNLFNKLRSERN